jgi:hypothetical protein
MARLVVVVLCMLIAKLSFSQNEVLVKLPKTGKNIRSFIPKGWIVIKEVRGDFNKDGIKDAAVVTVDSIGEKITLDSNRSVIILQGNQNGFQLSAYSAKAVLCISCGGIFGDPFEGIEFKDDKLIIYHYGGSAWRWSVTDKFRFKNNQWSLIGETKNSYWDVKECKALNDFAGTDFKDINFVTGGFEVKRISENCKLLEHKKGKMKVSPLVTFERFSATN